MNSKTIFWSLVIFWKLHYIELKAILQRFEELFEAEFGELHVVHVHSERGKLNILWFSKNAEI